MCACGSKKARQEKKRRALVSCWLFPRDASNLLQKLRLQSALQGHWSCLSQPPVWSDKAVPRGGSAASSFTNHRWLCEGDGMKCALPSNRSVNPCQCDWLLFFSSDKKMKGGRKKDFQIIPVPDTQIKVIKHGNIINLPNRAPARLVSELN